MVTNNSTSLKQKTVSGIGWSVSTRIASQLLNFLITVLLVRMLTPQDFGLIGMIVIFTGFASLFSELGFGAAIIQYKNLEERHLSSIFWLNVVAGLLIMGILMISSPLIAAFYNEPRLMPLTMVISVNFFIGPFNIVQNAILKREMNFRLLGVIETASFLLAGSVAIALAVAGFGVWSLVWQSLLMTSSSVLIMWVLSDWRPKLQCQKKAIQELLKFSSNLLGFNIYNYWIRNADNLLIGKFVGTAGLGIYSRAYSMMLLPLREVTSVVSRVMFPALSRIQDDKLRVKSIYLQVNRIIGLITMPVMCGLFVVAEPFVITLYGPKWEAVTPILKILCIVGVAQPITSTTGLIYQSQGRTDWMLRWGIASGIVTICSFLIGIRWGVMGVAIAYAIRSYVLLYPSIVIPGRLIGMSFMEFIKNVSGIFFSSLLMALLVWCIGLTLPSHWPHWSYLAIQVPIGAIIYILLIHLFSNKAYRDLRGLIGEQWVERRKQKIVSISN